MIQRMKEIVREHSMCVLATCSANKPHCSLMTYLTDEEGTELYFMTLKASRKFTNIMANPEVSILIDTRSDWAVERSEVQALTISGVARPVADGLQAGTLRARMIERHPQLRDLYSQGEIEIIAVRIEAFLLLDGVAKPHFEPLA